MITNTQKTIIKAIKETKDKDVLEWLIKQLSVDYVNHNSKRPEDCFKGYFELHPTSNKKSSNCNSVSKKFNQKKDLYVVYQIRSLTKDTQHVEEVEEDFTDCRTSSFIVKTNTDTKYFGGVVLVTDDEAIAYECAKLSNDTDFKSFQIARGVYKSTNKKHPEYVWYRYVQKVAFDKPTQHKNRFYEINVDKK